MIDCRADGAYVVFDEPSAIHSGTRRVELPLELYLLAVRESRDLATLRRKLLELAPARRVKAAAAAAGGR